MCPPLRPDPPKPTLANNKETLDLMPAKMMSKMLSLYEINYRLKKNKISVEKEFDLTNRELQLFYLLQQGYSYLEISEKIFISTNTIKTHARNIYSKLNVNSRNELNQFY